MSRLTNDPADFADEVAEGFAAAHPDRVRRVPGGVVRARPAAPGKVAVVIGGGSGHYPAFAGLVGPGLADGAVMGNVFASPSAQQVRSVARSAHAGAGVLLGYGNYAGDVLNFSDGADRLAADGIAVMSLPVTDDVASAPPEQAAQRRGVAGDVVVFKVAGAAAEAGLDLPAVHAVAARANDVTRTFGVAFSGCTLPGESAPLFTVPASRMALGMGIHGEPGVGEADTPAADGVADLLVDTVLGELPDAAPAARGRRVALLLNGLGGIGPEELFLVYRRVAQRLAGVGVTVVAPEVGSLVTSFDMAGLSLTVTWLDEELERYWTAPADAPAFRRGAPAPREAVAAHAADGGAEPHFLDRREEGGDADEGTAAPASGASREAATLAASVLREVSAVIDGHADELGRIDAVAGDGDHGIGMRRGTAAAADAAAVAAAGGAGLGTLLRLSGEAWADKAGGTSGSLWGLMLRTAGSRFGDGESPGGEQAAAAARAALDAVQQRGGAAVGDKTMVDALVPYVEVLERELGRGAGLAAAAAAAADAARRAAEATADLAPRRGRARIHGERAAGTPDAGAVSLALVAAVLAGETPGLAGLGRARHE